MKKLFLLLIGLTINTAAKNVEFANQYIVPASADLVELVGQVAQEIGHEGHYELCEPTKAGLQANAWNSLIWSTKNDLTQNDLLVINPVWFNTLNQDEQKFLIGRYLLSLDQSSWLLKLIRFLPRIFLLFSFLIVFLCVFVFARYFFKQQKIWLRVLLGWLLAVTINTVFLPKAQTVVFKYLGNFYERSLNQKVLTKISNKEAAISAFKAMDSVLQDKIQAGHNELKPNENVFKDLIRWMER